MTWQGVLGLSLIALAAVLATNGFVLNQQLRPLTHAGHDRRSSGEYYPLRKRVIASFVASGCGLVVGLVFLVWGQLV